MKNVFRLVPVASLALLAAACGGGQPASEPAPAPAPKAEAAPAPAAAPAEAAPAATPAEGAAPAADAAAAPAGDAAAAAPADAAAMTAILVTADAADGATDMTVSKCAGCKLGMAGKAEHSLQAHGYTLHFCSAECKANAEKGVDAVIAALK